MAVMVLVSSSWAVMIRFWLSASIHRDAWIRGNSNRLDWLLVLRERLHLLWHHWLHQLLVRRYVASVMRIVIHSRRVLEAASILININWWVKLTDDLRLFSSSHVLHLNAIMSKRGLKVVLSGLVCCLWDDHLRLLGGINLHAAERASGIVFEISGQLSMTPIMHDVLRVASEADNRLAAIEGEVADAADVALLRERESVLHGVRNFVACPHDRRRADFFLSKVFFRSIAGIH